MPLGGCRSSFSLDRPAFVLQTSCWINCDSQPRDHVRSISKADECHASKLAQARQKACVRCATPGSFVLVLHDSSARSPAAALSLGADADPPAFVPCKALLVRQKVLQVASMLHEIRSVRPPSEVCIARELLASSEEGRWAGMHRALVLRHMPFCQSASVISL